MSGIVVSGGGGFLGWHTRAAMREQGHDARLLALGDGFDPALARRTIAGSERLIHLAGVNRAPDDDDVRAGNLGLATQVAQAIRHCDNPPPVVVYANSTQAGNDSAYGQSKLEAGSILADAAAAVGAEFIDIRLPNLFGEHGRPFYNSVTATFSYLIVAGGSPEVIDDKELKLLHVQHAADLLLGTAPLARQAQLEVYETVTGLLARLTGYHRLYCRGEIPDLTSTFDRDLFNTYRSYTFPQFAPVRLVRHADARGSFFEVIRSHGGSGQSSFSTTVPGITRGEHFHRRKVERFTVLSGEARISLRRLFSDDVIDFDVGGQQPVAVDMPTMWAHKITNTGSVPLYTSFWTNDIFNPDNPDTITEVV